jgi:excisionase family DNA binding protein
MNLKTAAARLSIHYQTAYKLVRSGALPAVKIGGTYEISEAALDRYRAERTALRAGAGVLREDAPPPSEDRDAALAEVRAVAAASTTSVRGVVDTIAWVSARAVGDICVVRAHGDRGIDEVSFYDRDPRRRATLASIVQEGCFRAGGPSEVYARARDRKRSVLLSHVPQDRLRASIDARHRQVLDVVGVHSLVVAPVVVDGAVRAFVTLSRATPGAPYGPEDVEFAEAMAARLRFALVRTAAYRAGSERRNDLVQALSAAIRVGDGPVPTTDLLRDDEFAELVFGFDAAVVANDVATKFAGGDLDALVEGLDPRRLPTTGERLRTGELEYHDGEHTVALPGGEPTRFLVHGGLVRDDRARPRALVVVAQPLPQSS